MALIRCPECGKEISDKAQSCPNCGCPINNEKYKIIINSYESDTSALAGINDVFGFNLDYDEGMNILNNLPYIISEYDTENEAEIYAKQLKSPRWELDIELVSPNGKSLYVDNSNKVKCPSCNSTSISRISVSSKAISVATFGLFSNKRKKTFHCNHCKYEW